MRVVRDQGWTTVESLSPRGRIAKETQMSIRRSRKLALICAEALAQEGTLAAAQAGSPATLGITSTQLRFVFGDPWYGNPLATHHWWWALAHWHSGGLEKVERIALLNLPESMLEKLNAKTD